METFQLTSGKAISFNARRCSFEISSELSAAGFEILGQGASASVNSVGDTVIKIFSVKDVGSVAYLKYCHEFRGMYSWLPIVHKVEVFGNICIAEMEKLKSVMYSVVNYSDEYAAFREMTLWFYSTTGSTRFTEFRRNPYFRFSPEHKMFMHDMMEIWASNPINFDLHGGNVMYRNNNAAEWVITDPFYIGRW